MWESIIALEKQLSDVIHELQQLRSPMDAVLLREMGYQFENKLYRYVVEGGTDYTPVQVRTATIQKLQSDSRKQKKGVLKSISKQFPKAFNAVDMLKEDGRSTAHPYMIKDGEEERAICYEDLQACIERVHKSSIFKSDFEEVLKALNYLAGQLKEPLFVCTVEKSDEQQVNEKS
mmetsp:Transcript_16108/g.34852  ORF Transcript_16108/g.34852 Transcript_16108/m.34852 type:complete len:175 (+) Transcript_16108:304-828(+)